MTAVGNELSTKWHVHIRPYYRRTPRVGQHVIYYRATTRKPVSATIVAVNSDTNVDLRVGHGTGTNFTGVSKRSTKSDANVWEAV